MSFTVLRPRGLEGVPDRPRSVLPMVVGLERWQRGTREHESDVLKTAVNAFMIVASLTAAVVPRVSGWPALVAVAVGQFAFAFCSRNVESFLTELLVVLFGAAFVGLLALPVEGVVTFTFVLGVALALQALLEAALAFTRPAPGCRGWRVLSAACSLLLGILLLANRA